MLEGLAQTFFLILVPRPSFGISVNICVKVGPQTFVRHKSVAKVCIAFACIARALRLRALRLRAFCLRAARLV